MENRAFVRLMLLFLCFSYLLLSSAAVPTTRSFKSVKEIPCVQDLLAQKLSEAEELFGEGDAVCNDERMLMEIADYPAPGANPKHDPPPPATA